MNPDRLEKFDKSKLINMIVKKDEMIESMQKRFDGLEYIGRIFIHGEFYCLYIRKEKEA